MANHRNPLPIFIPCHRVVGKDGKLTGYAGGLAAKERIDTIKRIDEIGKELRNMMGRQ